MLKKYNKKSDTSYSIGVFPTIELLENRGKEVVKVVISPKGYTNKGVEEIISFCRKNGVRVEESQKSVDFLSKSGNTYAIGVYKKYQASINQKNNHLVLVNPEDMGNLGTICRTMLAFGFKDLAIVKPAVDIFDPKVGRASMGSIFKINFQYFDSFDEYREKFKRNTYTFMTDGGEISLTEASFEKPYSLVFGSESSGLDPSFKNFGKSIKIYQTDDVDSLNLAISVGISLHEATTKK
ncbi:TrmH family RNA methyltransferase [Patescibacteria group bacterium]|nr:TrmH family RNA methyltransferase [Patescibacteria group bacterium]